MNRADKPVIRWSKYWSAWECKFGGLARIGETPELAYNTWMRATLAGHTR